MKWKNKEHELDGIYGEIENKAGFYLFGAGDFGRQFMAAFEHEIVIKCYLDNDVRKQAEGVCGQSCIALETLKLGEDEAIIVTMSQISRVEPLEQLKRAGYRENIDFFIIEEFISVYYVNKYNKVYFSSISFLPSTACNLKCRYCLNFNPFAKKFHTRKWEALLQDVDLFFTCVDHIMLFHVSGGEPMLYQHIAELIEYIDKNYGQRIDTLRTVTNGTIVPSDSILEKLSKCNIEIEVDDYREAVPELRSNFELLIQKLKQYGIRYYINQVDAWIDLAPEKTDYSELTETELMQHRTDCGQSWQELRGGKLYSCNYASYAVVAGIAGEQDLEETYDLKTHTAEKKKELVEFRLGYTTKGYTNFCKQCRGFTKYNVGTVKPAEQLK